MKTHLQHKRSYPSLLVYTNTGGINVDGRYLGVIMLCTSETDGVIVSVPNALCPKKVGDAYKAPSFKMEHWQPFEGKVTLFNEVKGIGDILNVEETD